MCLTNSAIGWSSTTDDVRVCHCERNYRKRKGVPSIILNKTDGHSPAPLRLNKWLPKKNQNQNKPHKLEHKHTHAYHKSHPPPPLLTWKFWWNNKSGILMKKIWIWRNLLWRMTEQCGLEWNPIVSNSLSHTPLSRAHLCWQNKWWNGVRQSECVGVRKVES